VSRFDSESLLLDLISALIAIQLKKVEVRKPEKVATNIKEKIQRYDLYLSAEAAAKSGKFINVEMQASPMQGDSIKKGFPNLKSRIIYYLTDIHSRQPAKGLSYIKFFQSFQITFCNFPVFPQYPDFVNSFCICHRGTGEELADDINLITIEFPKLVGKVMHKNVKDTTSLEKWSIFLGFADNENYTKLIEAIIKDKEEIKKAMDILDEISTNEDERVLYHVRKKQLLDMQHNYQAGIKEGKKQSSLNVAKNLLNEGVSVEIIMKATGLTLSEIEELKID
jgi:predicted transposase/invertase (TIGR01784 family)